MQIVAILWHFSANECSCPPSRHPLDTPSTHHSPPESATPSVRTALQFREQFSLTILNVHKHIKMIIKRKFRPLFIFRTSAPKLMPQCCICIIYLLCMQMHLIASRRQPERERETVRKREGDVAAGEATSNNLHILACNEICNNSAINCVRVLVYSPRSRSRELGAGAGVRFRFQSVWVFGFFAPKGMAGHGSADINVYVLPVYKYSGIYIYFHTCIYSQIWPHIHINVAFIQARTRIL